MFVMAKHHDNHPDHPHGHHHGGHHGDEDAEVRGVNLAFTVVLNFVITIAEVVGGIFAGSLALISDSLHNFSDVVSLVISYAADRISRRSGDTRRTFGYRRAAILAALFNASMLIAVSIFLFREAWVRFRDPQPVNGSLVTWVALLGLAANLAGVLLLRRSAGKDMNFRSAYLHLLGDSLSSVGVIAAGLLIRFLGITWVDPLVTVLIAAYVIRESYEIIRDAVRILMQGVPEDLDVEAVVEAVRTVGSVENVHHVHVWSLDERHVFFEAHINIEDMPVSATGPILREIERRLRDFGITHVTVQFEYRCCDGEEIISRIR